MTSPQKQYHAASGNTEDLRVIFSKMGRIYSSLATLSRVLLKGGFSDNPGQKSWDTFAKTPQIRASPLHPQCNVDLKGSSHQESLQALSTLLGGGGKRAVTKTVRYKQSNRLTQGIFHKCPILRVFFPDVPRTFGQGCRMTEVT